MYLIALQPLKHPDPFLQVELHMKHFLILIQVLRALPV